MTDPQVPLVGPQASRAGPKTHLAGPQTSQAGLQTPLVGPYTPLAGPKSPSDPNIWPFDPLVGQQIIGATDGWTYGWMDGHMEYLPILQDFAAALLPSETSQHQRSRAKEPLTS